MGHPSKGARKEDSRQLSLEEKGGGDSETDSVISWFKNGSRIYGHIMREYTVYKPFMAGSLNPKLGATITIINMK